MGGKIINQAREAALQEKARKLEWELPLNRQKESQSNKKALMAQIKQLIDLNRVDRDHENQRGPSDQNISSRNLSNYEYRTMSVCN